MLAQRIANEHPTVASPFANGWANVFVLSGKVSFAVVSTTLENEDTTEFLFELSTKPVSMAFTCDSLDGPRKVIEKYIALANYF